MFTNVNDLVNNIVHEKVRELVFILVSEGYYLKHHESSTDIVNLYCNTKGKNVIGDIRIKSKQGSFRLEDKDTGKWFSFRKFDFLIEDQNFIKNILAWIRS